MYLELPNFSMGLQLNTYFIGSNNCKPVTCVERKGNASSASCTWLSNISTWWCRWLRVSFWIWLQQHKEKPTWASAFLGNIVQFPDMSTCCLLLVGGLFPRRETFETQLGVCESYALHFAFFWCGWLAFSCMHFQNSQVMDMWKDLRSQICNSLLLCILMFRWGLASKLPSKTTAFSVSLVIAESKIPSQASSVE